MGFTLSESLLVFSVFLIISSITAFTLKPQYYSLDDQTFLKQLQADLLFAQSYAISRQQEVSILFLPDKYSYTIYTRAGIPPLIERNYSSNLTVYEGSLPLYFKFLTDGNVSKFGSFYIKSPKTTYRFTVLIGKGRFYVLEV